MDLSASRDGFEYFDCSDGYLVCLFMMRCVL